MGVVALDTSDAPHALVARHRRYLFHLVTIKTEVGGRFNEQFPARRNMGGVARGAFAVSTGAWVDLRGARALAANV